jgi:hypothetical protein
LTGRHAKAYQRKLSLPANREVRDMELTWEATLERRGIEERMKGRRMRYNGFRYRAECRLAGITYGRPFGVDGRQARRAEAGVNSL